MKNSMSIGNWDKERFASLATYILALRRRTANLPIEPRYPDAEAVIEARRAQYGAWVKREETPRERAARVVRAKFGRRV